MRMWWFLASRWSCCDWRLASQSSPGRRRGQTYSEGSNLHVRLWEKGGPQERLPILALSTSCRDSASEQWQGTASVNRSRQLQGHSKQWLRPRVHIDFLSAVCFLDTLIRTNNERVYGWLLQGIAHHTGLCLWASKDWPIVDWNDRVNPKDKRRPVNDWSTFPVILFPHFNPIKKEILPQSFCLRPPSFEFTFVIHYLIGYTKEAW